MVTPELYGETAPEPAARGGRWSRLATGAELAFVAQVIVAGAVFLATSGMRDDHGTGFASGTAVLEVLAGGLPLLALAGCLHWVLFSLPVTALARLTGGRRWETGRVVVCAAAVTAAHAWWATALWDVPFGWAAVWIAGAGVLPLVAAWHARRRSLWWGGMLARVGALTGIALLVALVGAFVQARTGWLGYEPPRMERDQYVGSWIGGGGAHRLRLGGNGEAEAGNLPLENRNTALWDACSGTGTWAFEPKGAAGGLGTSGGARDRVTLTIESCGRMVDWRIGGTADRPELFTVLDDSDARRVITLHRP
ncbi:MULTISPECIES: hypothetical protein [unclassified Streptomyces]|uniref:hypothetical protein n=1 Tax=unclassified Streptomyces TaxID=2593676 RepID=UPI002259F55C|nr:MULTISPECIES: hypothetical protein [unclassified Streptomyces]MCX4526442.1 hypothetical protein [Streptomyces sp. NBC_01551]MCX4542995.1 hypothetical protein [Streptomyces sp. NBC_01565]